MEEYRDYLGPDAGRPSPGPLGLTPAVRALLVGNLALFIAAALAPPLRELFRYAGLVPRDVFHEGFFWQLVTYAFFHRPNDPFHLIFNMLALYVFGRDIENLYGRRPFLLLYLGAAVAGGALHCAVSFREPSPLLGASAAVYAVMVVYALHFPRQRVLFFFLLPLEVSFTVGLLIAFDLAVHLGWQTAGAPGGAANLVYLGGAAYGYAFFRLRGAVSRHLGRLKGQSARCEVAEEAEEEIEARLDSVLAKINREGMGALSKKEWEVLRKASKHYQRKT